MLVALVISYIIWILYSFLEGVREAFISQTTTFRKIKCTNWSTISLAQRFIFFSLINYIIISNAGAMHSLIFSLGMIPIFYYIQNGTYFLIKNKMNPETFKRGYSSDATNHDAPSMYLRHSVRKMASIFGIFIQILIWFI